MKIKDITKQYQPLFDHFEEQHDKILLKGEMDEIIRIVEDMKSFPKCARKKLSKKNKKIYICGPITGRPIKEVKKDFNEAVSVCKALGYEYVNPLEIVDTWDIEWEEAMKLVIPKLFDCNAICFLSGFLDSKGAKIEFLIAKEMNLEAFYIKDLKNKASEQKPFPTSQKTSSNPLKQKLLT